MKRNFIASMLASTFFLCSITAIAAPIGRSEDIPAPPDASYEVSFRNNCFVKISLLVFVGQKPFVGSIKWETNGWHELNPGETKVIITTDVNDVYYYAESLQTPIITWTTPSGKSFGFSGKNWITKAYRLSNNPRKQTIVIDCLAEKTANDLSNTNSLVSRGMAVGLYQDANYKGLSTALTAGSYDFTKLGIKEDALSSLKVPSGWSVTIYRERGFKGADISYSSDVPTLPAMFDDATSSVVITGTPPIKSPGGPVALGGGTVTPYTVRIKNDCFMDIRVLLYKYTQASPGSATGAFQLMGFETIKSGDDYNAGMTTKELVYYYAEMVDGPVKWDGKSQTPIGPSQVYNSKTYILKDHLFKSFSGTQTLIIECNKETPNLTMEGENITGVTLWESTSYSGANSVKLGVGQYINQNEISALGGNLGSIEVSKGWSITVYNYGGFKGNSKTFTSDQSALDASWKDKVYSFKIENNNKKEGNDITNKNKQLSPTGNDNTEAVSQNLAADQTYNIAVSKELSTEEAWERVKTVITPNGFFRDAIDNKFQTLTTLWKAFPRLNNTLRVKITIEKERSGTENDNSYNLIFSAEESGEKGTSVHDNVKYRQTRMLPKECDKFIEDLRRKVGGN